MSLIGQVNAVLNRTHMPSCCPTRQLRQPWWETRCLNCVGSSWSLLREVHPELVSHWLNWTVRSPSCTVGLEKNSVCIWYKVFEYKKWQNSFLWSLSFTHWIQMVFLTVFKAAMCYGLVRWPILCILISCVCAVCAKGRFAPEKKPSLLLCSAVPMETSEQWSNGTVVCPDRWIKS